MKHPILSTPYNLAIARNLANNSIADILGGYRWIDDNMPMSSSKEVFYNKFNNVYNKIEVLQQEMIQYYDMTVEDTNGRASFMVRSGS